MRSAHIECVKGVTSMLREREELIIRYDRYDRRFALERRGA
jgi:hypothetical protein